MKTRKQERTTFIYLYIKLWKLGEFLKTDQNPVASDASGLNGNSVQSVEFLQQNQSFMVWDQLRRSIQGMLVVGEALGF